jgi:phospholipid/cholesterol/gamma-HCH transport system substrate-binding protein
VGLFVTIGVGLIMLAILVLGGADTLLKRHVEYSAHFQNIEGLVSGAKVVLGGVQVGLVDAVEYQIAEGNVKITFSIDKKYEQSVRKDSTVEIATQGVLGDKFILINGGSPKEPQLPPGADVPNRPSKDIAQFFSKGDQLMMSLNSLAGSLDRMLKTFEAQGRSERFFESLAVTTKNLSSATEKLDKELSDLHLKNLGQIFQKINNGAGTLGALVNDPGLYDDVKSLMGGANRNRVIRNLVRQTIKKSEKEEVDAASKENKK